jgi:uncharacterized caspase-like protein
MWKALLPGLIALVTLGLSLVSGEVIKRDLEHKQVLALAPAIEPDRSSPLTATRRSASQSAPLTETARPVALVMGNAAYPDAGLPLSHPLNNARVLADALRDKGFDVEFGENLTRHAMERAIEAFKSKIEPGSPALIFFSGFGIQAGRQTYLIPVNAQIWTESDVRRAGVSLEPVLNEIDVKGAGAKLVVLDASRRNPYERRFRSSSFGLAAIHAPDETLVMYSAAPGKVVSDGEGELSPLLDELIAQLRTPGQSAEEVFQHTRVAVARKSQRKQMPWVSSSLVQDLVLAPADPGKSAYNGAR